MYTYGRHSGYHMYIYIHIKIFEYIYMYRCIYIYIYEYNTYLCTEAECIAGWSSK